MVHAEMLCGKIGHHSKPLSSACTAGTESLHLRFWRNMRLKSPGTSQASESRGTYEVLVHQDQLFAADHINGDLFRIIRRVALVKPEGRL